jgi:ribonuclease HII
MKPISEIRAELQAAEETMLPLFMNEYASDGRAGVQALVRQAEKKAAAYDAERTRVAAMRAFENRAAEGYLTVGFLCGIDEAGRGPLAGPVAAGACILPKDHDLLYLNDSKKLSPEKRAELYEVITQEAVSWAVGLIPPERIDEINILQATYEAMRRAVSELDPQPEVLVNDAVRIPGIRIPQVPVIKGDAKCLSVAAASILAKVTRDRLMLEYDQQWPEYGFAQNKGYGSADHIAALKKYGPCPIHRRSFIGNFVDLRLCGPAGTDARPGWAGAAGTEEESGRSSENARAGHFPTEKPNMRTLGTEEEARAAEYLASCGIRIVEKNFRCRQGEIDLIGEDTDGTLVFFEVKYRSGSQYGTAAEQITPAKQQTICEVSDFYRYVHHVGPDARIRYDAVAIDGDRIRWIRNAFPYCGKRA